MGARPPGGPGSRALARRARAAEPRPHPEPRGPALLLLVTPGAGGGGGGGRLHVTRLLAVPFSRRRSSPGATWTLPAAPRAAADSPPVRAPAGKAGFSELGPLIGEDPLISAVTAENWLQKPPGSGRGLLATRACKI
ncbi:complexin-1 isoform X1 [Manis javanica]|uniref:complexin-1 isoform X1 n=1 Tax=Manis javanica TaxID=9974 RepID=UPI003C6D9860